MYKYIILIILLAGIFILLFRNKDSVSAKAEITINAPLAKVWEIQTNFSRWKKWNTNIEKMEIDGDISKGTIFTWKANGITIISEITDYVPMETIAWNGKTYGIRAHHEWKFSETDMGVTVFTKETFTGFLPRLLPSVMRNQISKALNHGLSALKKEAEGNDTIK